jgi:Protein of unknown function (DUF2652)
MSAEVERGYLVLADISGFTGYLAETELDHANEILADLIGEIVAALVPPFHLEDVEGDAVFTYGPLRRGELLLEVVEHAYVAFRRRRELIDARTTCPCNACRRIGALELKFVVHEGEYVLQEMARRTKVLGSDVNLAHRLLKNSVAAVTGWQAYVLLTDSARLAVNVSADWMHAQTESYEHLGDILTWSYELESVWAASLESDQPEVDVTRSDWHRMIEIGASAQDVWDVLNDVEARAYWSSSDAVHAVRSRGGRTATGGVVHCHHGRHLFSHSITQFHPFDFMTEHLRVGAGMTVAIGYLLAASEKGTELTMTARLLGRYPRWVGRIVCKRGGEKHTVPTMPKIRQLAEKRRAELRR